jgi:hypothetical protein
MFCGDEQETDHSENDCEMCYNRRVESLHSHRERNCERNSESDGEGATRRRETQRLPSSPLEDKLVSRERCRCHRGVGNPQRQRRNDIEKRVGDACREHGRTEKEWVCWNRRRDAREQQSEVVRV